MTTPFIPDEYLGSLTTTGIGDAYALPFEYHPKPYVAWADQNDGAHYERHPKFFATTKPGNVSDDTQMSVAVAEVLLHPHFDRHDNETQALFDRQFVIAFQRNPHAGYSRGMSEGFRKAIRTQVPIGQICAAHGKTEKSGAAMRATPLGFLPDVRDIIHMARLQGAITHQGDGLKAAEAAALAAHYMLYRLGPRSQMPAFVARHTGQAIWTRPWRGKVGSPGMESTRAALTAVVEATSLRDLLIRSAAYTGDVDTVGAIAMGAAWGYSDLPNDLPMTLWDGLENGPYGRDYFARLDAELLAAFSIPRR